MARVSLASAVLAGLMLGGCTIPLREVEPYREVACFEAAKISLRDAVEAAEVEGGQAIDAAYRQVKEFGCLQKDAGYYDVTVLVGGQLSYLSIDAATDQIQPRRDQGVMRDLAGQFFERMFEGRSEERIPAARKVKTHLHDAISMAEKDGGKAMEARVEERNGKAGFTIKLAERGKLRMAWVDGG